MDIFVSVGTGLNPEQEAFVCAVEERLRTIGLVPHTIGRNTFSAFSPLRAVDDLMDRCVGAVVIAVERYHFPAGVERRGSAKERPLAATSLPTAWNQIEATMAHSRGLPLLVIVDEQVRCDGLLEKGNDWYVQEVPITRASLNEPTFNGVLDSWRTRIVDRQGRQPDSPAKPVQADPATMSIGQLLSALKPAQLWAVVVALSAALAAAFALGAKLAG